MNEDEYWSKPLTGLSSLLEQVRSVFGPTYVLMVSPVNYDAVKEVCDEHFPTVEVKKSDFVPVGWIYFMENSRLKERIKMMEMFNYCWMWKPGDDL